MEFKINYLGLKQALKDNGARQDRLRADLKHLEDEETRLQKAISFVRLLVENSEDSPGHAGKIVTMPLMGSTDWAEFRDAWYNCVVNPLNPHTGLHFTTLSGVKTVRLVDVAEKISGLQIDWKDTP